MNGLSYSTFASNAIQQYQFAALGHNSEILSDSDSVPIRNNNFCNNSNYFNPADQVNLANTIDKLASQAYTEMRWQNIKAQAALSSSEAPPVIDQGYWGSDQTASRIIETAKGLIAGNSENISIMIDAIKKGFDDAQSSSGGELPEISAKTRNTVFAELDTWAKSLLS